MSPTPEATPLPAATPPSAAAEQWRALLAVDAERLAQLARDPRVDRALRGELRPLLWQLWQTLTPPAEDASGEGADGAQDAAPPLSVAELRALVERCAEALRRCGDDRGAGARPIGQVRIHKPFGDRVVVPPSARQTARLALTVAGHFKARLALTEARLKWFEDRANSQAPTSVAQVRQPDGDKERLGLELLRKRGTSKYS